MNSRLRLLAALGLAAVSGFSLHADAVSDARLAFADGDFGAMKTGLDAHLASNPGDASAAVLRAISRLGLAAEEDLPKFFRDKLGANYAAFGDNGLAIRFPRPIGYIAVPAFTDMGGGAYQYTPAINLYTGGNPNAKQPGLSYENKGPTPYTLTLKATQGASGTPYFDATLYLDGRLLGFINAIPPSFPFEVFTTDFFPTPPNLPEPFDLDGSSPSTFLSQGSESDTFTVIIPPKSVMSVGLVVSPGEFRLTPTSALPSTLKVVNGHAAGITPPRYSSSANFNDVLKFAADLDASTIVGVVSDLSLAGPGFSLALTSDETGHPEDIVIAYPDIQVLLAEIKFLQGLRLLGNSYNLGLKLTPTLFDTDLVQIFIKNPSLFVALGASAPRAADRTNARALLEASVAHYFSASDAGLWTRGQPESGAYLFGIAPEIGEDETFRTDISVYLDAFRDALSAPVLLAELSDDLADDETLPDDAAISLAPFFGPKPFDIRKVLPVVTYKTSKTTPPVVTSGIVPGTSTKLLTSGLLPNVGTAWWENFLSDSGLIDVTAPAVVTKPLIQTQPVKQLTVPEGASATLSVVAEFFPITGKTYRWHKNKLPIPLPQNPGDPDPTQRTFTIPATVRGDAGDYTVVVTNIIKPGVINKTTSSAAKLVVTYGPEFTATPAPLTVLAGRPAKFTAKAVGVPAVTYQWYKGETLIKGAKSASYSITAVKTANAGDYSVRATSGAVTQGTTPVALIVHEKPRFTLQPIARTVIAGADVTFTVATAGNPAPTLQWFKNNLPIDGQTGTTLVLDDVVAGLEGPAGTYHVVATNTTVNAAGTGTQVNTATSTKVKLVVKP